MDTVHIHIRKGNNTMKFGLKRSSPVGITLKPACDYFGVNHDDYVLASGNNVIDHSLPASVYEGVDLRLAEIIKNP